MADNHMFQVKWFVIRRTDAMAFRLPSQPLAPVTLKPIPAGSSISLICTPSLQPYTCGKISNITGVFSPAAAPGLAVNVSVSLLVVVLKMSGNDDCPGSDGADPARVSQMLWEPRGIASQLSTCSYGSMTLNANKSKVIELALPCSFEVLACDYMATANIARPLADAALNGLLNSFTHTMWVMPYESTSNCAFLGISAIRGRVSWLTPAELGVFKAGTVMQELMHNYGLFHGWREETEYTDGSTFMGMAQSACPSGPELLLLGWATPLAVLNGRLLPEASLSVFNATIPATYLGQSGVVVRILPDWLPGDVYTKNLYLSVRSRAGGDWQLDAEYDNRLSVHTALRVADAGIGGTAGDPQFDLEYLMDQGTLQVLDQYRLVIQARELLDDSRGRRMVVDVCRFRSNATTECRMPPIPTICPPVDGYTVQKDLDCRDNDLEAFANVDAYIASSLCDTSPSGCLGFSFSARLGFAVLKASPVAAEAPGPEPAPPAFPATAVTNAAATEAPLPKATQPSSAPSIPHTACSSAAPKAPPTDTTTPAQSSTSQAAAFASAASSGPRAALATSTQPASPAASAPEAPSEAVAPTTPPLSQAAQPASSTALAQAAEPASSTAFAQAAEPASSTAFA
ncbi:hypothetical protein HYH03_002064 [Edaphochlamys debaryana]|uniref:Peptidase M11 gametolysin domain-containing protein n=1 Tax=Edaphochlamys debaryana TaxID=47281 RepID=A0A836C5J4_9CHLO|nr:hypothetical protein HYH03_002064 [Edaphochlamys debaryana]|eukprot:KAG2499767.1 hypothetical protein HYH03_002064 [Edaphochlamys debaryana]